MRFVHVFVFAVMMVTVRSQFCANVGSITMPTVSQSCQTAGINILLQFVGCLQEQCSCNGGSFDMTKFQCANAPAGTCGKLPCISTSMKCLRVVYGRWNPVPDACKNEYASFGQLISTVGCKYQACAITGCSETEYSTTCADAPALSPLCGNASLTLTNYPDPSKGLGACSATKEYATSLEEIYSCDENSCKCIGGSYAVGKCSKSHTCATLSCRASRIQCIINSYQKLKTSQPQCSSFADSAVRQATLTCIPDGCQASCADSEYQAACQAVNPGGSGSASILSGSSWSLLLITLLCLLGIMI
eukprot:PhF_6_TR37146/c0_g1_i2/m.54675